MVDPEKDLLAKTKSSEIYKAMSGQDVVVLKIPMAGTYRCSELEYLRLSRHKNIVKLLGVIQNEPYKNAMVFEYMAKGDLANYLMKNNYTGASLNPARESILLHIFRGLIFLHAMNLVHRDIKCNNIFLTSDLTAKIGDFGMVREVDPKTGVYASASTKPAGTYGYIAPEVFPRFPDETCSYSQKVDIYGLGMVILSVGSDNLPDLYPDAGDDREKILEKNRKHELPKIGAGVSSFTKDTFLLCFNRKPENRPSAEKLLDRYKNRR
ncbi:MAG: protein kinase [Gammaproteobacteria bacterium]